ncbi:MAG: SRPBCC domain-containing protein [Chitinophagaceae bacterium]|nr:MAG: SRPBCC domain-containing protein [Chitinophagaceae bacterium]
MLLVRLMETRIMASITNDIAIELSHDFSVPVDILFRAWTELEHLQAWWRPMGAHLVRLTNELHPGGQVVYEFETEDGERPFVVRGEYKHVKQRELLEYTWNWEVPNEPIHDGNFVLRIGFENYGGGSRLRVRQDQFTDDESVQPHRDGWESAMKELERYLEQL